MKCFVSFVCFLSGLVFVCSAPFFPAGGSFSASSSLQLGGSSSAGSGGGTNGLTNILSNIDLPGLLRGVNSFVKLVGVFCPPLSQVLDNVIQNVTSTAFRVFGSAILRSGGLGGGSNGGGQKVSVVLPTFPPDDEDDEDEDTDVDSANDSNSPITSGPNNFNADVLSRSGSEVTSTTDRSKDSEALVLSRDNDENADTGSSLSTSSSDFDSENNVAIPVNEIRLPGKESGDVSNSETTPSSDSSGEDIKPTSLYTSPVNEDSNLVEKRYVRVTREAEEADDQDGAESAPQPAEDIADVDDQDRNKRYLPHGGGDEGHASGGSGNFLFDIIRLVAGSGATEEHDEKANSPGGVAELDIQKSHEGYSGEGIPGPITRLFVIANRGLANLVQDLILRLAATSEKIVNFKARLITSLI